VLVDDLSRLSRDNHFLLTLCADFRFNGVRILSRADSLDTDDHHAKLGFQMRGIVNELYLDDLRDKTLRGQKGQKSRGCIEGAGGSASAGAGRSDPAEKERSVNRAFVPSMRHSPAELRKLARQRGFEGTRGCQGCHESYEGEHPPTPSVHSGQPPTEKSY